MTRLSATQWQALPDDVVSPAATRVLLALIVVHRRDGRATVRTVAAEAGRTVGSVHPQLRCLARSGLAAQEPGADGTLRPLVAPVPKGDEHADQA